MRRNSLDGASVQWHLITALASTAYLYFNLFASMQFPFLLGGDQLYFWMGAQRLLNGQAIYRDFFQYTPPGADLTFALSFKLFGETIWVTNLVALLIGAFSASLCFSLARQLMKNTHAFLTTAVFLVFIYGKFLNATHHWFAVFFILLAVRVSMHQITTHRVALSGMLLGVAAFFNHAHAAAALLGFIAFLFFSGARTPAIDRHVAKFISALVFAFAVTLLCLYAHYLDTAGLQRVWFCLVGSVFRYVGQSPRSLGLPGAVTLSNLPMMLPYLVVYLLVPLVYGFTLWKCWHLRKSTLFPWNQVTLLCVVGTSIFLEVAVSINILRMYAIAMPAIILLIWIAATHPLQNRALLFGASFAIAAMSIFQIVQKHRTCNWSIELPGGRLATTSYTYDKLHTLAQYTRPEEFFLESGWPGVYLPLRVQSPLYMPTLSRWDSVYKENIRPSMQQIETKHVRYVLWTHHLDEQCDFSVCQDDLSPVRAYLASTFRPLQTFSDGDTLWQRIETGEPANSPAN